MKYKLIIFIILLFIASNLVCAGWWNESYAYRRLINCSGVSNGVPVVINGSNGFKIDGYKQVVWTYCQGNTTALYYNNYSDYVVANDTAKIPFDIEQGNGTSYDPESVWGSDFRGVYFMDAVDVSDRTSNNKDGTGTGTLSVVDGIAGDAILFNDDGANNGSISTGDWVPQGDTRSRGVCAWIKPLPLSSNNMEVLVMQHTTHTAGRWFVFIFQGHFRHYVFTGTTADHNYAISSSVNPSYGSWQFFCAYYNSTANKHVFYVNGSSETLSVGYGSASINDFTGFSYIDVGQGRLWNGTADNVMIFTGDKGISFFDELYNNQKYTPGYGNILAEEVKPATYFTITAHDYYNTSFSILNFSAVVNGTSYNTTNGTITTNIPSNASVFVTINLSSDYNGGYFNRSYYHNVSTDLSASLWQSVITLRGVEKATGKDVNNFGVNTTYKSNSTSTGELVFRFQAGDYVINVTPGNYSPAYYGFQKNISVNPLDNKTVNLSFYNTNFTLFVKEIITNLTVTNYNLTAYYNVTGWSETHTNQSSNTTLHLTNETYRFIIYAPGFAPYNDTLRVSNGTTNQTIFLYSANSLWVYAREEELGGVISNFSVLIYNAYATYQNDSDINQSIAFFNNVTPGLYTVRVTSPGYSTRYYNVTMTSGHHADLTAYLSVVAGNTTLLFKDKHTHETLEDVNYAMYRIINGSWQVISSGQSDITGRVFLSYTPYTEYKFICSKTGYEQKNFTLQPVYSSYDVLMTPIYEGEADLQYGGVTAYLQGTPLNNNNNLITLFVSSPHGTLLRYGLNLSYKTIRNGGTGNNAVGGSVPVNITVMGASINDYVNATYWWNESNGNYRVFSRVFYVGNASGGNVTLEKMRTENFGMSTFELVMISMGVTLAMAGMGALLGGAMGAGILSILCMSVFTYLGFVPLYAFIPFALISLFVLISSFRGGY